MLRDVRTVPAVLHHMADGIFKNFNHIYSTAVSCQLLVSLTETWIIFCLLQKSKEEKKKKKNKHEDKEEDLLGGQDEEPVLQSEETSQVAAPPTSSSTTAEVLSEHVLAEMPHGSI